MSGQTFTVSATAGITVGIWEDPSSGALASRINPDPEHPHLRYLATTGVEVEFSASVAGLGAAPLDAVLGGALFAAGLAEWSGAVKPPVTAPAGQSSVQRFTPPDPGHYTLVFRRDLGGAVTLHIDAQ